MIFVPAKNFTPASRTRVTLIVMHTAECNEAKGAARNVAEWFRSQPRRGEKFQGRTWGGSSAHYSVDDREIVQSVREEDIAWHASEANGRSIGVELAGRAAQSAADWDDAYSRATLERAAGLVAALCKRWQIEPVHLTPDEVKLGRVGLCGHVDVTRAWPKAGGHTDPGPHFPWSRFVALVSEQLFEQDEEPTHPGVGPTPYPWASPFAGK